MEVVGQSEVLARTVVASHTQLLSFSLCRLLQHLLSSLSLLERSLEYRVPEEVLEGAFGSGVQP